MTSAATEQPVGKAGPADLIEIFYSPSAVFARRRDGKFGLPYVALVVLGLVLYVATRNLIEPIIDTAIDQGFAAAVAKDPSRQTQIMQALPMAKTVTHAILLVYYIIVPFLVGLVLWLVGKIAKIREIGTVAMMIATFSLYPKLIGTVVAGIFAAVLPEGSVNVTSISLSPARFIDVSHSPALAGFLARFDLFILWGVVLLALGARNAAGATKGQAWTAAIVTWFVFALPSIWGLVRS